MKKHDSFENELKESLIDLLENELKKLKNDENIYDDEAYEDYDYDDEVDFLLENIFDNAEIHGDVVTIPKVVMDEIIEYLNKDGDWEIYEDE